MAPRDGFPRDRTAVCAENLLAQLRQAGSTGTSEALCEQIVELTLGLADTAARSFRNRGIEPEDLTQVARLGLMKAIRGYDPQWGCSFAAYAVPTITGEIKRHFRDQGWLVKPPRPLQELRSRMVTEEETLRSRLRRQPRLGELAERLGVEVETVAETKVAARGFAAESLSTFAEGRKPVDPPADGDPYKEIVEWESVRPALHSLTPRQRQVLRLRFVDDLTQTQIAARIGVSQMQVSRILTRCMNQMRAHIETERGPSKPADVLPHRPVRVARRFTGAPAAMAG